MLELSCLYSGVLNDYVHRSNQIKSFDWLEEHDYDKCLRFLERLVNPDQLSRQDLAGELKFEQILSHKTVNQFDGITFSGAADIVSESTVFEIKCVKELSNTHFVQLAMYAWLWNKRYPGDDKKFQLVNLTTGWLCGLFCLHFSVLTVFCSRFLGEVWQINPSSPSVLEDIASDVISQYLNPPTLNQRDDEFVLETQALVRRYIPLSQRAREAVDRGEALESLVHDLKEPPLLTIDDEEEVVVEVETVKKPRKKRESKKNEQPAAVSNDE
jgi:hypothetical protein